MPISIFFGSSQYRGGSCLPAGVATRDIDDVSIYLDKNATELGIQVKMP